MVRVSPDDSLYTACCMLRRHRLHRLPVVSGEAEDGSNAVLSVITYMSILRFLVGRFREAHELFYKNICELVGYWGA